MTVVDLIGSGAAIVLVAGYVVYLIVQARRGPRERIAEAAAREEFTRTGHWPDQG